MIDAGGTLQLLGEEGAGTAHVDIDKEDTLEFCMEFEKPFDRQLKCAITRFMSTLGSLSNDL